MNQSEVQIREVFKNLSEIRHEFGTEIFFSGIRGEFLKNSSRNMFVGIFPTKSRGKKTIFYLTVIISGGFSTKHLTVRNS